MNTLLLLPLLLVAFSGCSGCDLDERWWLEARHLRAPQSPAIDLDQEHEIRPEVTAIVDAASAALQDETELSEARSDIVGRWLATRWQDLPDADERASAYVVERGDEWFEVWLSGSHNDC